MAEAGLPATACNVRMPVNKTGYQAPPFKIEFCGVRRSNLCHFVADGNNSAATDQHMTKAQILGREDLGIGKKFQQ